MKYLCSRWLGIALLALAPSAYSYDLLDAWHAARDYNADFAAARANLSAGREQAIQGRAQLLPQVGASANYSYTHLTLPANLPGYDSTSYGVSLKQPLFDISKYTGYQKGQIGTRQAEISFQASEQQLMLTIAQAYFKVLLAQDTLAATQASKKAYQTQLAQARAAFDVGTATITDTHEAQAGYDAASAREISAQNDLEVSQYTLRQLTGLEVQGIQPLQANLPLTRPLPDSLQAWSDNALRSSLTIQAAEQALEYARQTVTEKRGNHLPVVSLEAGYTDSRSHLSINQMPQNRGSSIGVGVTLPLFAGGGINSQVREALAKEEAARDQLEASKRQVRENVRQAFLGITNGAALVRAQQQLLVSAKSKLDSTRLGKEVGIRTNLDVLQAEQSYYDALTSLATAKYNYLLARLALAQSAGQLDEALLADVNRVIRH